MMPTPLHYPLRSGPGIEAAGPGAVEADHQVLLTAGARLCAVGHLVDKRMALQKLVQRGQATVESVDLIRASSLRTGAWPIPGRAPPRPRWSQVPRKPGIEQECLQCGFAEPWIASERRMDFRRCGSRKHPRLGLHGRGRRRAALGPDARGGLRPKPLEPHGAVLP
jgi:hypothetical protein